MARYEDTATPFAEAQFAGVRERKQQEARKQEKFAKKLLLAQTVDSVVELLLKSLQVQMVKVQVQYYKNQLVGVVIINYQDLLT